MHTATHTDTHIYTSIMIIFIFLVSVRLCPSVIAKILGTRHCSTTLLPPLWKTLAGKMHQLLLELTWYVVWINFLQLFTGKVWTRHFMVRQCNTKEIGHLTRRGCQWLRIYNTARKKNVFAEWDVSLKLGGRWGNCAWVVASSLSSATHRHNS